MHELEHEYNEMPRVRMFQVADTVICAREAVEGGNCVVIGLQSTGETRMSEVVKDRGGDMDDFASGIMVPYFSLCLCCNWMNLVQFICRA